MEFGWWNEKNCKSFLYLIEKGAPVTVETASIVSNPSMLDVAIYHFDARDASPEDKKNIAKALFKRGVRCRERIEGAERAVLYYECIVDLQKELPSDQSPKITIELLNTLLCGGKERQVIKNLDSLFSRGYQIPQEVEGVATLGIAVNGDKKEVLKYLIEKRSFNINHCDSHGRTPLIYSLRQDYIISKKCFSYLLNKGADPNGEDEDGYSALHYAYKLGSQWDKLANIKALIQHGAEYQKFLEKRKPFIRQALKEIEQEKERSVPKK